MGFQDYSGYPVRGQDYLGGTKFESAILKTHPAGWAAGIFYWTFGEAKKTIRKMLRSRKVGDFVIHLAPFDYSHEYNIDKYMPIIEPVAIWCNNMQIEFPNTKILISPFCEHNHKRQVMSKVFARLRKLAPNCGMVNSIWKGDEVANTITEIHLEDSKLKPRPKNDIYLVSFDGFGGEGDGDFTDTDVQRILEFYKDARHVRAWNFRYNGKFGHKDTTVLNKRKHWPDEHYLRGHAAIMKKREGSITWPNTALYKPFADDHGTGGKDNKAMCILNIREKQVSVRDSKGKIIDVMTRAKDDHIGDPKGGRFYSKKYAYQLADIAEFNTGSRLIKIGDMPLTDGDLRSGRFK